MRIRNRDWSICWQLSAVYAGLLVLILGVLGVLLYTRMEQFLIDDTENRLVSLVKSTLSTTIPDAEAIAKKIGESAYSQMIDSGEYLMKPFGATLIANLDTGDTSVAIYNTSGTRVLEGGNMPKRTEWPAPSLEELKFGTVSLDDSRKPRMVVVIMPIPVDKRVVGTVVIRTSLGVQDAFLGTLRLYLVVGIALAALIGILVSAWLTRRVLRPLDHVADTATAIASGDLKRRVGLTGRRNEIGLMAAAFDSMVDQLEAALRTQRQFVADASHELRTPLTALNGMTEMLLLNVDQGDPSARQRLLRQIRSELGRMTRLVAELLDLSRLDNAPHIQQTQVDLTALVREMLEAVRVAHPDRVLCGPEGGVVMVMGDADRLRQVALNLIDNALKYTRPGGHVTVSVKIRDGKAELAVIDNGEGIDPAILPHVFDRFYRADKSRARTEGATRAVGGVGLGLAITRAIVNAHGGTISASSAGLEKGSTFTVLLPLSKLNPELMIPA
jgi:two-component system OmpR family sensor kinase